LEVEEGNVIGEILTPFAVEGLSITQANHIGTIVFVRVPVDSFKEVGWLNFSMFGPEPESSSRGTARLLKRLANRVSKHVARGRTRSGDPSLFQYGNRAGLCRAGRDTTCLEPR